MLHTFDPYAILFSDGFGIRWYGLSYLAGFVCAYYIILYLAKSKISFISEPLISDYVFYVAIGTIVGGRLGYCIFYSPDLFLRFTSNFPFWGVLAVNEGGMASHGGIVGIIVSALWYGKKHGFPPLHAVDLAALTGPVGVFFGRLANFVNGELVGRQAPDGFSLGVKFPQDILLWPTYESERLKSLAPAVEKMGLAPEKWSSIISSYGTNVRSWHELHDVLNNLLNSVQNKNAAIMEAISPALTLRHPSQLYEAALEGVVLFTILAVCWKRVYTRPGTIMGLFLTFYSLLRIVGEQFRMPDAQIGYQLLGLTRGQWLSFAMFALGLIFIVSLRKRNPLR